MGNKATISFGIIIAHHSVPLAIAYLCIDGTKKLINITVSTLMDFIFRHHWVVLNYQNKNIQPLLSSYKVTCGKWDETVG